MIKIIVPLVAVSTLAVGCAPGTSTPHPAPAPPVTSAPAATSALGAPTPAGTSVVPPAGTATSSPAPATPTAQVVTTAVSATNWTMGPLTVRHRPPVPPVPVVTQIRYAAHPTAGYDRVVFDISGGLPGYTAKYVTRVYQDGSGKPVTMPGRYYLLLVFNPAQAHRSTGTATVRGIHRVDFAMLESYGVVGDYEGYVSVALGLNGKKGFRIGELPGRVYVDVRR